jgi:hypothetical protein
MLVIADGIGAGHLNLAKLPQRLVEPQQKISYRAKKLQSPLTRPVRAISDLCNVSKALQFFFELVGVGAIFILHCH